MKILLFLKTSIFKTILLNTNNFKRKLFNPLVGLEEVLTLQVRMDVGYIAMKGLITLLQSPRTWLTHRCDFVSNNFIEYI